MAWTSGRAVALLTAALSCGNAWSASDPNWILDTAIQVPAESTMFVTGDKQGNVYTTGFNNTQNELTIGAFKISNATSAKPIVDPIDSFLCGRFRGYAGITTDDLGNVYLSVDLGEEGVSVIKKVTPSLRPDTLFGTNGTLQAPPQTRFQGLAFHKGRLLAGVNWARILIMDPSSGRLLGGTVSASSGGVAPTIRDIAVIPSTDEIVGLDRESVYLFSGGNMDRPEFYNLSLYIPGNGRQTAAQGIFYSQILDRIYFTKGSSLTIGSTARSVSPESRTVDSIQNIGNMMSGGPGEAVDTWITPDASYMFLSDIKSGKIVRYRNSSKGSGASIAATVATNAASNTPPAGGAASNYTPTGGIATGGRVMQNTGPSGTPTSALPPTQVIWNEESVDDAVRHATALGRRAVVYFMSENSYTCQRMNKEVFSAAELSSQVNDAYWVKVDTVKYPTLAKQYGFYKVPVVFVYSQAGQMVKRFDGEFSLQEFLQEYRATSLGGPR